MKGRGNKRHSMLTVYHHYRVRTVCSSLIFFSTVLSPLHALSNTTITSSAAVHTVYNLEVDRDHVYEAGSERVWVHNNGYTAIQNAGLGLLTVGTIRELLGMLLPTRSIAQLQEMPLGLRSRIAAAAKLSGAVLDLATLTVFMTVRGEQILHKSDDETINDTVLFASTLVGLRVLSQGVEYMAAGVQKPTTLFHDMKTLFNLAVHGRKTNADKAATDPAARTQAELIAIANHLAEEGAATLQAQRNVQETALRHRKLGRRTEVFVVSEQDAPFVGELKSISAKTKL